MNLELVRQVISVRAEQDRRFEIPLSYGLYVKDLAALPMARGVWPLAAVESTGNTFDLSGNVRTLTYNGNPLYSVHNSFVPYLDLDGTGDSLSRADEAGLDILGTESYVATAQRGLTMYLWFWVDVIAANVGLIGKFTTTSNQRSYVIRINSASNTLDFIVSSNGTAETTVSSTAALTLGVWNFVAARYTPSTELALWHGSATEYTKYTNTTAIPTSIFSSTARFEIGGMNTGALLLDGRVSAGALYAALHADGVVDYVFETGRGVFGV